MTSETRVPPAEITGIFGAIVKRMTKRKLGRVPDQLAVAWNHPKVLKALFGFSHKAEKWDACDEQLKSFAHMAAVSVVGCGACLDFGYFQIHDKQLDVDKARAVPRWRESEKFTPLERDVLEYAEAMSHTPLTVTDELSQRLQRRLGVPALVELTAFIAAANMVSRNNVALGIRAEGISVACGLEPLEARVVAPA
jgi:alkylhydroperoxidase family enzyme